MIFDNQHEIQRLQSIDELRNLGINPYPHFLRRDMNISKFRLKFNPADTGKFGLGMGTGEERTGGNGKETENAGRN